VPFRLNEDWALITRTKLPAIVQAPKSLGDHWAGLSNGYTTFFLSPEHARVNGDPYTRALRDRWETVYFPGIRNAGSPEA
jgi:hypothetical protein